MNIVQIQDMLKFVPDDKLKEELANPNGPAPQYLILSEVVRRDKMRSGASDKPSTTVLQDILGGGPQQEPQAFASGGFISASESMGNAGVAGYPTQQPKLHNPMSANTGITSMFAPSPMQQPAPPQTVNNVQVAQPQSKPDDGQTNDFNSPSYYEQGAYANGGLTSLATGGQAGDLPFFIKREADRLGIDPVDLATAISYETKGTFNPAEKGPKTKWGRHIGLIQMGEPQRKQYGYDPEGSLDSQMNAVGNYLADRGVKPGMGLLDIYSTINAGAPGLYDRSDEKAGGAPGTVLDKVRDQMSGHKEKAMNLFRNFYDLAYGVPVGMAGRETTAGLGVGAGGAAIGRPDTAAAVAPSDVRTGGIMSMIGLKPGTPGADRRLADMKSLGAQMMQPQQIQAPDPIPMAEGNVQGLARLYTDPAQMAQGMADYSQYIGQMASGGEVRMADGSPRMPFLPVGRGPTKEQAQEIKKIEDKKKEDPYALEDVQRQYAIDPALRGRINQQRGPLGPTGLPTGHMTPDEAALSAVRSQPTQYQLSLGALEKADKRQREYLDKLLEIQRSQAEDAMSGKAFLRQLGIGMLMNPSSLMGSLSSGAANAINAREQARASGASGQSEYDLATLKLAGDTEAQKAQLLAAQLAPTGLTKEQQAQYLFGKIVELRNKAAEDVTQAETVKYYDSVISDMMRQFGLPGLPGQDGGTSAFRAIVSGSK